MVFILLFILLGRSFTSAKTTKAFFEDSMLLRERRRGENGGTNLLFLQPTRVLFL
jgi:hypothetical protein